jgi:ATP-binding cassette subfamily B multidrug efflux pump
VTRRILRYLQPYWLLMGLALVLIELAAYAGALEPLYTQQIIDAVIVYHQYDQLNALVLLLIATVVGISLFTLVQQYIQAYVGQHVMATIRRGLMENLQRKSFAFYDRNAVGQIVSRMTVDVETIGRLLGSLFENVATVVLGIATSFLIMYSIHPTMAVLALAPMPVIFIFTLRFSSKMFPLMRTQQEILGVMDVDVQQNIFGMKVVRSFRQEDRAVASFERLGGQYLRNGILSGKLRAENMPLLAFTMTTGVAAIYLYGGSLILAPAAALTIGQLYMFTRYMTRLILPLRQLSVTISLYTNAMAGAERIFGIMDEAPDVQDAAVASPLPPVRGEVQFDHVSFAYLPGKPVLEDVTFTAAPGEVIAILGATGSGKSTLIYLIPRFYDVTGGRVLIDGRDVRDVTLHSLRWQVGVVLQEVILFTGTIRDNLTFGKPDATQDEVEAAAKLAKAHDFITAFPQGYNTLVGERGITLSGGQKQRVAIARTLLTDPRILILDDSLSFVDAKTEQDIQQALKAVMQGRTTFVIAQRLSTIKNAHRILVLDNGRIAEVGTHEELMALHRIYRQIYETQFEALLDEPPEAQTRERVLSAPPVSAGSASPEVP